ncbi:MAG: hypothetical protein JWN08_2674 [Frankiales bacterium]|nr:hypothetical protein [Frankiales bacterium]
MSWAPVLLLLLGAEMRLRQWSGARSLWLDEALIARSLVSRDYVGLVADPLQGEQAAPVLWLWASRLSLDLFGEHEKALRLVPLVGGLSALVLVWLLARRLLPAVLVPVAVLLTVLSPSLLYFSNDVKPYSVDVAVCLGLVLLALRVPRAAGPSRPVALLALAGSAAVWASFASVFVLAGLSLVLVLTALREGRGRAVGTGAVLSAWVVSLGLSYVAVLHRLADSEVLSSFWGYTFPDRALDLPTWLLRRAVELTEDPLELAVWPVALALLGYGAWQLRSRGWLLAASAVPVATVAAALSLYPFASRLALWLVPLAAIALAAALPSTAGQGRRVVATAAALVLVAAPMATRSVPQVSEVLLVEELRPVMEQLQEQRQPGDLVLVDIPAKAPYDFYTSLTGLGRDGVVLFATTEEVGGRCNDPVALKTGRFATQRVWVVFAHPLSDPARLGTREDLLARIGDVTNVATTIEEFGAKAVLFDPAAPSRPPSTEPRNPERCLAVVRTVPPTGRP